MRISAFSLILFFICLNLSIYLINANQVLTGVGKSPYTDPTEISGLVLGLDITGENLVLGVVTIGVGFAVGLLTGQLILGGTLALVLFAINLVIPILKWILFGFPIFLGQIGVPPSIVITLEALMSIVWFWFFLGFFSQRTVER